MDTRPSNSPVKRDTSQASVSSSSSIGEKHINFLGEVSSINTEKKDNKIVEQVQNMALESGNRVSNHLTTSVKNKSEMFEEEEEGELDYEEDEGEIPGTHDERNGVKNDTDGDKEEGELEEDDEEEEGEEGEILSDEDDKGTVSEKKSQENQDLTVTETDGPEEGEVIEEGDSPGSQSLRRKVCRYFTHGGCTWGMSCRFLHPGLNDKGAYQMLPIPGQYPSPFPKAPTAGPAVHPETMVQAHGMTSLPGQDDGQMEDEFSDRMHLIPEVAAPPKKETAWERGLKLAKEIKKAAQKRKEEDADFQEKRMVLGITADENDDENDKENLIRRREMVRATRLEKESVFDEGDMRHRSRGGGDIVTRWRDKKQPSPDRERDRRKRRGNRSPSSSPERDRRNRRRGGEKEKHKGKVKETLRERDKQRTKTATKETEKKHEEKVKKQKEKESDGGKEKPVAEEGKNETAVIQEKPTDVKEQASLAEKQEIKSEDKKTDDEKKKRLPQEKSADFELKSEREAGKKDELVEGDEREKPRAKALGISSSRLPNDEWMDPWQRVTSPKRHSASSRSSRSRSSSSSSDSSRSSRSRSRSGSESRSTSRSTSRSRSRSVSESPSRSSSRSRSGSRSHSRSRSGSVASASDHSSSSGSSKEVKAAAADEGGEEKDAQQASHDSSESESESEKSESKSKSPTSAARKSPAKPKTSPDKGPPRTPPRTPPVESSSSSYRNAKDGGKNRYEYSRAEKIQKWQEGMMRQGSPWDRRVERTSRRPVDGSYSRDRAHNSRRKRSPELRRRSRSPRSRNEERRRPEEGRTRERSSSADSMEHALARPSSPRATRERSGMHRESSVSSSGSDSASSETGSESEEERHPVRTRRAGPEADQVKQAPVVPLSSGNIRYTGHKDIKLTLNKSVTRTENREPPKSQSQHSLPARTDPSGEKLQTATKKRTRDPSPVSEHTKEIVSSSVTSQSTNKPDKRSVNSQAEAVTSGKANSANTSSRREELLRELKAVEDAIARKRARIE